MSASPSTEIGHLFVETDVDVSADQIVGKPIDGSRAGVKQLEVVSADQIVGKPIDTRSFFSPQQGQVVSADQIVGKPIDCRP